MNPKIPSILEAKGGNVANDSYRNYVSIDVDGEDESSSVLMTAEEARALAADILARANAIDAGKQESSDQA